MKQRDNLQTLEMYDLINKLEVKGDTWQMTVLDGDHIGEKAVYSDRELMWDSKETGSFFASHRELCGGITESGLYEVDGTQIYAEVMASEKHLIICGAGHVSMPVISIGKMLGFHVTVIDDRMAFLNNAASRGAHEVICGSYEEILEDIPGDNNTFFVIVTRGHRHDRDCLRMLISKPHFYIGMIGSRGKVAIVKDELANEGISRELLDSVHTPIGLDIGAETPEEIAVAIMAEIIQVKNKTNKNYGIPHNLMKTLLDKSREPMVLATVVRRKGSAPRDLGSKMLIRKDGSIEGTIGGGMLEAGTIQKGMQLLRDGETGPAIKKICMEPGAAESEGMVCGGNIDVLLEVV